MAVFNSVEDAEKAMNALSTASKVIGVGKLITNPTPLGVGMAVAQVASKEMTGKSLEQHAMDYARQNIKAPTGTGNVGRNRKGKTIQEGPSNPTPKQKSKKEMRVGQFSKGGLVSHKSVFDLE
tara:strand:- start:1250 stop:1618 length:369 start_codon:yes stop_codon:yes gene_type:complete